MKKSYFGKTKHDKPVNLLPKEYRQLQKNKKWKAVIVLMMSLEVMAYIGEVVIKTQLEKRRVNQQLERVTSELLDSRYDTIYAMHQTLENEKQELDKWEACYEKLMSTCDESSNHLVKLLTRVPKGVYINHLSIEAQGDETENGILVEGTAECSQSIINYQAFLEEVFGMRKVTCLLEWDMSLQLYEYKIEIMMATNLVEEMSDEEGEAE